MSPERNRGGLKGDLNKPFSKIILEKVRPAQKRNVSTRDLLTLLSLLSLTEAEAEAEPQELNPRLYQTEFHENTRISSVRSRVTEKPYFDTVDVVIGAGGGNTPRYQARPQRQFDVPPVRLSGRSGGVGGTGGVETVTSPPSYYPQSVSWAPPPPQELPTDRLQRVKESPQKVRAGGGQTSNI